MRGPRPDAELFPDATARLVATWAPVVLRWCMRLGTPGIDAEDAAHDVMERLVAEGESIRDPQALPAWLYRTTRRVIIDAQRRAWLRYWVPGLFPDLPDPARGPSEQTELAEETRAVRAILAELPVAQRELLVLCDMEERSATEVAELLGMPVGTVKSRLARARVRFARIARKHGLDELAVVEGEEAG